MWIRIDEIMCIELLVLLDVQRTLILPHCPLKKPIFISIQTMYLMLPHEECCTDVGAQNGPVPHIDMLARRSTAALTLTFRAGPLISGGTMRFVWFP